MRRATLFTASLVLLGAAAASAQNPPAAAPTAKPLEVGAVAPDFEMAAATREGVASKPVKLSDLKGKTVVIAFFPKARTSGCTIQMTAYRDQYEKIFNGGKDAVLLAVSADPPEDLASWAKDANFPFMMASDKDVKVATAYGALSSRPGMTNRNLFIVGPDGKIAYRATPFREVDPTSYTDLTDAIKKTHAHSH